VPSSTFSIQPVAKLDSVGIDVAVDDVLFNLVTRVVCGVSRLPDRPSCPPDKGQTGVD
jgi:hypothetical protein